MFIPAPLSSSAYSRTADPVPGTNLEVVSQLTDPIEVCDVTDLIFVEAFHHVTCVYVNDNESSQSNTRHGWELAADHCHNLVDLGVTLLEVVTDRAYRGEKNTLGETDYYTPALVLHGAFKGKAFLYLVFKRLYL